MDAGDLGTAPTFPVHSVIFQMRKLVTELESFRYRTKRFPGREPRQALLDQLDLAIRGGPVQKQLFAMGSPTGFHQWTEPVPQV